MPDAAARRRNPLSWVLAPATDPGPAGHAVAAAALRILLGLMWIYNVAWKRAPDFGEQAENGLYRFTSYAVEHPVLPPFSWLVERVVLPNIQAFGWGVLAVETALAVMLLTGTYVRLACLLGIGQALAIGLSVAYAPDEWPWAYWLMIGAHLLVLFSASGRVLATDAVRGRVDSGRTLGLLWGVGGVLVGLYSIVTSLGEPLAASGTGLRSTDLSMSLGTYNLLGGLVLAAVGAMLAVAAAGGPRVLAVSTVAVGALAGLSLHAQIGFSDPVLGGSPTSAAYYWSVAVVALALARRDRSTSTSTSLDQKASR